MPVIIKLRGMPWQTTSRDVKEFFRDSRIAEHDIHLAPSEDGKACGIGFACFYDDEDARKAMQRNGDYMGKRYVELFLSSNSEMEKALQDGIPRSATTDVRPREYSNGSARNDRMRDRSPIDRSRPSRRNEYDAIQQNRDNAKDLMSIDTNPNFSPGYYPANDYRRDASGGIERPGGGYRDTGDNMGGDIGTRGGVHGGTHDGTRSNPGTRGGMRARGNRRGGQDRRGRTNRGTRGKSRTDIQDGISGNKGVRGGKTGVTYTRGRTRSDSHARGGMRGDLGRRGDIRVVSRGAAQGGARGPDMDTRFGTSGTTGARYNTGTTIAARNIVGSKGDHHTRGNTRRGMQGGTRGGKRGDVSTGEHTRDGTRGSSRGSGVQSERENKPSYEDKHGRNRNERQPKNEGQFKSRNDSSRERHDHYGSVSSKSQPASMDTNTTSNLFLKLSGLPYTATNVHVHTFFDGIDIIAVHIIPNKGGRFAGKSSGSAFIECATESDQAEALGKNGQFLGKRYIKVEKSSFEEIVSTLDIDLNLLSGQFPSEFGESDLNEHERSPGSSAFPPSTLTKDGPEGKEAINLVVESANINLGDVKDGCVVGLRNLPTKTSSDDIFYFFRGYRTIPDSVRIHYLDVNRCSGDAMITLVNNDEAKQAIRQLSGKQIGNRKIELFLL